MRHQNTAALLLPYPESSTPIHCLSIACRLISERPTVLRIGCRPLCEAVWWRRWQQRPHNFDGALDLHLAVVAVNVARYVAQARREQKRGKIVRAETIRTPQSDEDQAEQVRNEGLTLLDPCAGTGTLAAAAVGCGKIVSIMQACNATHSLSY